jgi:hypothetical protein
LLGLVLWAAPLHAQGTEEGAAEPAAPPSGLKALTVGGIRYGAPLGASVYAGVMVGKRSPDYCDGPSLIGEVGQDGMRVSLGMSSVSLGGTHRGQMSVIRTWDDHGDVRSGQTYIGPELVSGLILGITVGHYWRIGDGGGKARIFSIGSFIGL